MRTHTTGKKSFVIPDKVNELKSFSEFLKSNIATATQAAVYLNIYRPNACRYKRQLEKAGHLFEVKKGICPITKFPASFLTTNRDLLPAKPQLELFDVEEGMSYE